MATIYVLPVLAWVYRELGQADEAARVIGAAIRRAHEDVPALPGRRAAGVQALVALRQRDLAATEHALDEGLSLARATPYPQGEGRLQVYGQLHLVRGEPAAARVRLEEAHTILRRLGARRDLEHVEQLLAALG